jgi:class 3 adenylate cyclase
MNLPAHNAFVREELRSHEGFEVKPEGDGFMVAFGGARKALQCAIAVQRSFAKRTSRRRSPCASASASMPASRCGKRTTSTVAT